MKTIHYCKDCKKEIYPTSIRCYSCNNKIIRKNNKNCHSKIADEKRKRKMLGKKIHSKKFKLKQSIRMKKDNPSFKEITRKKISEIRIKRGLAKGNKNPNWKGGIHKIKRPRDTQEYKNWRKKVFERDNYTCQKCKQKGGKLEAHHKKSWKNYPKLRFIISNGLTLCVKCHPRGKNQL